jgi:hypothetical protein
MAFEAEIASRTLRRFRDHRSDLELRYYIVKDVERRTCVKGLHIEDPYGILTSDDLYDICNAVHDLLLYNAEDACLYLWTSSRSIK